MPLDKHLGKQGCNCQFCSHKSRSVNSYVHVQLYSVLHRYCCQFAFIIYLLLFVILPVVSYSHSFILISYFKIVSVSICYVSSDYLLFDYSVLFLSWYWKCVPDISIPITTTIQQVNKHHTTRLHHLTNFSDWVYRGTWNTMKDMK
jgi:hypothetical protein